tara:strand:- start:369 stop:845 length:477 start_codon:yes stop_codon:yes gene_type:complete
MKLNQQQIIEMVEELKDTDEDFFWDTLDGETDVMDFVDNILVSKFENEANMKKNLDLAAQYKDRAYALETKDLAYAKQLQKILNLTEQQKIPSALATVSRRKGSTKLTITDAEKIPSQLCKVVTTPDNAIIKKQLQQGVKIDGAELTTGSETISIRRK